MLNSIVLLGWYILKAELVMSRGWQEFCAENVNKKKNYDIPIDQMNIN